MLLLLGWAPAAFSADPWAPPPTADGLHAAALRPETARAPQLEPGEWWLSAAIGYFNIWHYTWHVGTAHSGIGRHGEPLDAATLAVLREQYLGVEPLHQIDLEGWRSDLVLARGLPGGLTVGIAMPWVGLGQPAWDALPEEFHELIGAKSQRRDLFPRGDAHIVMFGNQEVTAFGLDGGGIGDVAISLSGPGGRWAGASHRWLVTVEAPTGEDASLQGSGAWDGGLYWSAEWGAGRRRIRTFTGYTTLGGRFLGQVERRDTWHAGFELLYPLGRRIDGILGLRGDTSPLAGFDGDDEVGQTTGMVSLGARLYTGRGRWIAFALGEDITAIAPDFTLNLQVGTVLGRRGW